MVVISIEGFVDIHQMFFLLFEAAIEAAGYTWFLENVVNNGNGGWPLALGSDRFVEADFDVAEVAGIS